MLVPVRQDKRTECSVHGEREWKGHIRCVGDDYYAGCGAAYSSTDGKSVYAAKHQCTKCGKRLVPPPNLTRAAQLRIGFTMRPCCDLCFEAWAFKTKKHNRGDSECKGAECPYHGTQIRKEMRRGARASVGKLRAWAEQDKKSMTAEQWKDFEARNARLDAEENGSLDPRVVEIPEPLEAYHSMTPEQQGEFAGENARKLAEKVEEEA